MRPSVYHLVYVSAARVTFTKERLVALLRQSREKNRRLGITGLLIYRSGWFMQVLEGEKNAVRTLFARIAGDARHRGVTVMDEGEHPRRQFPEWSMGFRDLDDPALRRLAGFSEFMNRPRARGLDPKGCLTLLALFAANGGPEDPAPAKRPALLALPTTRPSSARPSGSSRPRPSTTSRARTRATAAKRRPRQRPST
jgi:hypothetical protein